ncbi:MAG: hypothetical protein WGN25_08410 [Candidatus Electrothrix sp. GW3-4]|uniref:hypothetical protein n=1 Tax=Candidatus Electrothrix sp. GW3-4 TaxID=3126740 RepID=UPI0030CD15FE
MRDAAINLRAHTFLLQAVDSFLPDLATKHPALAFFHPQPATRKQEAAIKSQALAF